MAGGFVYNVIETASYFQATTANGDYRGARNGMVSPAKDRYKDITSRPNFNRFTHANQTPPSQNALILYLNRAANPDHSQPL